jgi:hypothetical protein
MRNVHRNGVAIGLTLVVLLAGTPRAFAVGLSDEDYSYLETQHIDRGKPPMLDLSPKEQARLHNLINEPRTATDPALRDKNVRDELALFLAHQQWEEAHPGQLWDTPSR